MRDALQGRFDKARIKMKKLLLCVLLAVSTASIAAADSIMVVSGATTITVAGTGTTTYSNPNFNGWNIITAVGSSNSSGLTPFGIDLTTLATCTSGACLTTPLVVLYSDINFNVPVSAGGFQTAYSGSITGSGTTTELAWATSKTSQ